MPRARETLSATARPYLLPRDPIRYRETLSATANAFKRICLRRAKMATMMKTVAAGDHDGEDDDEDDEEDVPGDREYPGANGDNEDDDKMHFSPVCSPS